MLTMLLTSLSSVCSSYDVFHKTNSMQLLHLNMNSTCLIFYYTVALHPLQPQQHTDTSSASQLE